MRYTSIFIKHIVQNCSSMQCTCEDVISVLLKYGDPLLSLYTPTETDNTAEYSESNLSQP